MDRTLTVLEARTVELAKLKAELLLYTVTLDALTPAKGSFVMDTPLFKYMVVVSQQLNE